MPRKVKADDGERQQLSSIIVKDNCDDSGLSLFWLLVVFCLIALASALMGYKIGFSEGYDVALTGAVSVVQALDLSGIDVSIEFNESKYVDIIYDKALAEGWLG